MNPIPSNRMRPRRCAHAARHRRFEAQALGRPARQPFLQVAAEGALYGGAAEAQWRPMLVEQHARAWTERGAAASASVDAELLREVAQRPPGRAGGGTACRPLHRAGRPSARLASRSPQRHDEKAVAP